MKPSKQKLEEEADVKLKFTPIEKIRVYYVRGLNRLTLGTLALKDRRILFEYDPAFLETQLSISPYKLPLKPGVAVCSDYLFDGLFGVFADSLPDGWGRLLLDRKLMNLSIRPEELTVLDRLRFVGKNGMGALQYEPEIAPHASKQSIDDLDRIADECAHCLESEHDDYVDHLLALNGSSAGARPKILVQLKSRKSTYLPSDNLLTHPHNDWIVKFSSSSDPKDIGAIEYAYHLMAQDAGLRLSEAKLFRSKKNTGYFGTKRFDRTDDGFLHMHTVAGLLHADYRLPSLSYETILKATLWLTKSQVEVENQYKNALFNVLAHNRDDHAKNFSFLLSPLGDWTVSPAYDLTFSQGPAGEHSTSVMGEGRKPTQKHLLKLAESVGIHPQRAIQMHEQVRSAITKWETFADQAAVSTRSKKSIAQRLLLS